ncbi:hypothetical protein Taro_006684 [Colocasia esculenta]|uniref:Uncharacterized protein n=1 Tax=Colocasia esculenta TaxID=4460 RepID=A0A843TRU6_COLES|nr:hypothetical protein [Colocasia esculenta]
MNRQDWDKMSQDVHCEHTFSNAPSEFLNMKDWRTPDVATFHDLRLGCDIYPTAAAPETSNVINIPQKEAGLRGIPLKKQRTRLT